LGWKNCYSQIKLEPIRWSEGHDRVYVPCEWFKNAPVTVKVDVYSFGALFSEISNGPWRRRRKSSSSRLGLWWQCWREHSSFGGQRQDGDGLQREREAAKVGRDVNVMEGPAMKMVVRSPSPFSSFQVNGH